MMQKMEGVVELKALESLVSQASKLPVSLPDVKVRLHQHLAAWPLPHHPACLRACLPACLAQGNYTALQTCFLMTPPGPHPAGGRPGAPLLRISGNDGSVLFRLAGASMLCWQCTVLVHSRSGPPFKASVDMSECCAGPPREGGAGAEAGGSHRGRPARAAHGGHRGRAPGAALAPR